MQERNFNELMSGVFKPFEKEADTLDKLQKLAAKNERDLSGIEAPQKGDDFLRVPTAAELLYMRQWAIEYKKSNPGESKRQVRKATQNHFKIRIYRASYKKRS